MSLRNCVKFENHGNYSFLAKLCVFLREFQFTNVLVLRGFTVAIQPCFVGINSVLPVRDCATFSLKKSKCCILNRLGVPFVAYKFAWGQILNKYAVTSLDRQNNDRKVSECLSLTSSLFVLLTTLTQFIHLKMTIAYSQPRISLTFIMKYHHD